jgi:hypothetical protein
VLIFKFSGKSFLSFCALVHLLYFAHIGPVVDILHAQIRNGDFAF